VLSRFITSYATTSRSDVRGAARVSKEDAISFADRKSREPKIAARELLDLSARVCVENTRGSSGESAPHYFRPIGETSRRAFGVFFKAVGLEERLEHVNKSRAQSLMEITSKVKRRVLTCSRIQHRIVLRANGNSQRRSAAMTHARCNDVARNAVFSATRVLSASIFSERGRSKAFTFVPQRRASLSFPP